MTPKVEPTPTGARLEPADKPEGPASAAILAAGAGALSLGILTTLAEANATIKAFLTFYDPVGPLSGKTTLTVVVWLLCWGALHMALRKREVEGRRVVTASLVLIGLGLVGTFPIFFQAFAHAK
ncbi:hypothetical protein FBY31_0192 [Arthrobacter sp. SLBN-100]|uniref:hypothetical protein n=1 Tax=Arthrobacter sp. SLBN-100 TaxID=2768450 RepID=UPI00114D84CE|nr:hypothetical protein [Arthrobacter sp. SLBN-100]TQJ66200.1 hypothetical protein FBY31_0192 [Arthrobacter sp. SLBN-100]